MASTNLFGEQQTTTGRIVNQVPQVASHILTVEEIYDSKNKPNHVMLRDHLQQEGRVTTELALRIIKQGMISIKVSISGP